MKRTIKTISLLFLSLALFSQEKNQLFELSGEIRSQKNGYVYLIFPNNNKTVKDSCLLKNGKFSFKGTIDEPTLAYFRFANDDSNGTRFYIEPGHIKALAKSNHFNKMKLTGSKTQKEYEQLQKEINAITEKGEFLNTRTAEIQRNFITNHLNSCVSAYILSLVRYKWAMDTLGMLFSKLDPNVQKSYFGKRVAKYISEINNNSVGKIAKDFTAIDINGKNVSLSDFKDKYVLLNFWASWCKPCRASTPHLMAMYKKYRDFGFDVIAISGDEDTIAWKKAVLKDNMEAWYNLLSEKKNDSVKIHDKYAVYVFPTLIIIDKNGLIIERYMGSEEELALDRRLMDIFNKEKL